MKKILLGLVLLFSLSMTVGTAQDGPGMGQIDFDGDGSGGERFPKDFSYVGNTGLMACNISGNVCR